VVKIQIIYKNEAYAVGVVQIIHGMSEHSGRYLDFAEFLNKNRYIVILSDHRGHGIKASNANALGSFTGSFETLVFDQVNISQEIKKLYPDLPVFILGHSMGSFIAQKHMKVYSEENFSYIFMGSCFERKAITLLGKIIFKFISLLTKNPKKIFNNLIFLGVNSKISDSNKNSSSWLSRDKKEVQKFLNDPYCGFSYAPKFYYNFLDFLSNLYDKDSFGFVNKNTPIFIVSGERDPIGLYGKGVKALFNFYISLGFKKVSFKLYSECRHELLNELNKGEVYQDILKWIDSKH